MKDNDLWLIGAGSMAYHYAKILDSIGVNYQVIGNKLENALALSTKLSRDVYHGGIEKYINSKPPIPRYAILCTPIQTLAAICSQLCRYGVEHILVEKPGGLNGAEINALLNTSLETKSSIYIGYNRRFYSSVLKAKELIAADGGPTSLVFEFTEWSDAISEAPFNDEVKRNWIFANSSHVIDMAFYLAGFPRTIQSTARGSLDWHQRGSIFVGSGITEYDVPFSYHANWAAPGRWWIEVLTKCNRYIFRPLESLGIQKTNSLNIEPCQLDNTLDLEFKPGLFLQTQAFLDSTKRTGLLSLVQQCAHYDEVYEKIIMGSDSH